MHSIKENPKVKIYRDKITKQGTLEIHVLGDWQLYVGYSIDSIDKSKPILIGNGNGVFPLVLDATRRCFFEVVAKDRSYVFAEKLLPMAGGFNFRDLGGIKTIDGRQIKWSKLFRADELTHLTDDDLLYLASIQLTSVIDFRAISESRRSPDKLPPTVNFTYPISITPGNLSNERVQANMQESNVNLHMKNMNRALVTNPMCVRAYKTLFTILQHKLSAPIVFHCTAGKDRTGMATALLLYALGVSDEVIMDDYMASKVYISEKYAAFIEKYPTAEPIFTVKRGYLEAGLHEIRKEYGSIEDFLTGTLNVDLEKMRQLYLGD